MSLSSRRLLALLLGGAVAAVAARLLVPMSRADLTEVRGLVWLVTGAHLAQQYWRPRRTGRLVWRARVAGTAAIESGLVAGRSAAGRLALATGLVAGTGLALGVISTLPDRWRWVPAGRPVLLAAVALGLGWTAYREARFTGRLALTATGVRDGGDRYPWAEIRAARPVSEDREEGVSLRLDPARLPWPRVGGREVAVSDERLAAAIEHFRSRPEALGVGLPVTPPEPAGPR